MKRIGLGIAAASSCGLWLWAQAPPADRKPYVPTAAERQALENSIQDDAALPEDSPMVGIYRKAVLWQLRHPEETYTRAYYDNALKLAVLWRERRTAARQGRTDWVRTKGRVCRAYRSRVDDSLQPYMMVVPESYDPAKPQRLDVVLHGRNATLTEVSFLAGCEWGKPPAAAENVLRLEVFGRTNNAYRWAGETDVWEALEDARRHYSIDPDRIVLRGFSMGGAGAWHLGLHHPDRWAAVEAGAGFVETKGYARLSDLPPYQDAAIRIYDSYLYTPNIVNVPFVGYGGELDPQLRASRMVQEEIAREGLRDLRTLFLVGPKTEHKWHPDSKRSSDQFLDAAAAEGRRTPGTIRFVTYTTRYNRCFWLTVDKLEKHYERAELQGSRAALRTKNVARLSLDQPGAPEIDGQRPGRGSAFEKAPDGRWRVARGAVTGKRHGLQGPIDDAFLDRFVVLKPSAPNPEFDRFSREWRKWMRAELPLVDKLDASHHRDAHVVVFGDPLKDAQVRALLPALPVRAPRAGETLKLIYPNAKNPNRYVVLNSLLTFGAKELGGTNALLFPRFGDWAIVNDADGRVVEAGLFDENWKRQ